MAGFLAVQVCIDLPLCSAALTCQGKAMTWAHMQYCCLPLCSRHAVEYAQHKDGHLMHEEHQLQCPALPASQQLFVLLLQIS